MVTALLAAALVLTGCGRSLQGTAATGPREVDPAYFFAGDVPTYRQRHVGLSASDAADRPCGLLTRDALAEVGEIGSMTSLFALDECDVDIKVRGEANRHS